MLLVAQLVRRQCRPDLHRSLTSASSSLLIRSKSTRATQPSRNHRPSSNHLPHKHVRVEKEKERKFSVAARDVPDYMASNVDDWRARYMSKVSSRLIRFGIPPDAIRPLLKAYMREMREGNVFRDLNYGQKQLARIADDLAGSDHPMDQYYTKILFEWVTLPRAQEVLESVVSHSVISRMQALFQAADLSTVSWQFLYTRRLPPRRFIMHVGPTNSGKTHNALRALAASRRGIYAGPLRLLAYEIFDRLNNGQIVPLGMEAEPGDEADAQSNIDLGENAANGKTVVVTKKGNPKYVRLCNMVTGEEHKIVSEDATLLSCTVEMTPLNQQWDVAVIDEIQLIADSQRGGAWTAVVLGLPASEIHLCGEESAVPLVQAIVEEMGDSIEIKRYERLTPLVVADQSLGGDLSRVKKGDCVVAFSRTGLFGLKSNIEKTTKMRCALAYGRLPPEIRSEQAALFNDPYSNYDVLVGSDAIGMGLNLKIKRVIFEAVAKWDGGGMSRLSTSQIKQIAGRAGRFGLHEKDSVGVVTTLHPADLEVVREALKAPFQPLRYARLHMGMSSFSRIVRALPWEATGATVADVYHFVARMSPLFKFQATQDLHVGFEFIDEFIDCLPLASRLLIQNSPCPWRDGEAVKGARAMLQIHRNQLHVSIEEVLHRSGLLKKLNHVHLAMEGHLPPPSSKETVMLLGQLETVHKVVVLYLWFTYRYPIAYPQQSKAFSIRHATEHAMDWCLEVLHQMRIQSDDPVTAAREAILRRRPVTDDMPLPEEIRPVAVEFGFNSLTQEEYIDNVVR